MRVACWCLMLVVTMGARAGAVEKILIAEKLNNPESAVVGADGKIYVTITGKPDSAPDGELAVIENGQAKTVATGMSDPRGIGRKGDTFYIADKTKVWSVDKSGKAEVFADTDAFPVKPKFLNDIEIAPNGDVLVSESGAFVSGGAIYRISPDKKVTVVADTKTAPAIKGPNGLLSDGPDHVLLVDVSTGKLFRIAFKDGSAEEINAGLGGGDGVVRDAKGRIYIGDVRGGKVFRIDAPGAKPVVFAEGFKSCADIVLDDQGRILVPDSKAGTLTALPITD